MKHLRFKKGFTIAEIMIAMMLLGGIAIILTPTLINDNEKQIFATSLKKVYTQLQQTSQAIGLLQAQGKLSYNPDPSETFQSALELTSKIESTKNRTTIIKNYKIQGVNPTPSRATVLKNGMIFLYDEDSTTDFVIVDINGAKQPNTVGKDVFYFELNAEATVTGEINTTITPYTAGKCPAKKQPSNYCENPDYCKSCANEILNGKGNGKIYYY